MFLAEDLTQGETERDPEEHDMTIHRVPVEEFERIAAGRTRDGQLHGGGVGAVPGVAAEPGAGGAGRRLLGAKAGVR